MSFSPLMTILRGWWKALLGASLVLGSDRGLALASSQPSHPVQPPNVLFLLTDDQRWDTIGALGNPSIQTPNLDRLVNRGFTFTNAFCMGSMMPAVCIPSRAMLLTGRSLLRATQSRATGRIPRKYHLMPQQFRTAGYRTIGIGKWHNDRASLARSFTDGGAIFFGGMEGHTNTPLHDFDPAGQYRDEPSRRTGFSSEIFADQAIKFLREGDTRPFFLYVAFTAPHDPREPPPPYDTKYQEVPLPPNFTPQHPFNNGEMAVRDELLLPVPRDPEQVRAELGTYYGMISHLDEQIGRIMAALESTGKAENTIIVFASDHGLALGSHGLLGKQNLYEHSIRAPLIFSGPGIPSGQGSDALVYLYDVFPTLCDLTGQRIPPTVEGRSLGGIMARSTESVRREIFGAYRHLMRMVRTDQWKLITYPWAGKEQLFNLSQDPLELADLSQDRTYRNTKEALQQKLERLQLRLGDPFTPGPPPPRWPQRSFPSRIVNTRRNLVPSHP